MTNIEEARKAVGEFLKKTLNVKEVKVVKMAKEGDGWGAEVEAFEESAFIKALDLPTTRKVQDRNIYEIKLDGKLEVQSYGRREEVKQAE